jgi:hypothetical protein
MNKILNTLTFMILFILVVGCSSENTELKEEESNVQEVAVSKEQEQVKDEDKSTSKEEIQTEVPEKTEENVPTVKKEEEKEKPTEEPKEKPKKKESDPSTSKREPSEKSSQKDSPQDKNSSQSKEEVKKDNAPEKIKEEEIIQKYKSKLLTLEQYYSGQLNSMYNAAKSEYDSNPENKKDIKAKYAAKAIRLKEKSDATVNLILFQMKEELKDNQYSIAAVDEFRDSYHKEINTAIVRMYEDFRKN